MTQKQAVVKTKCLKNFRKLFTRKLINDTTGQRRFKTYDFVHGDEELELMRDK
jgi:hypothetical protein